MAKISHQQLKQLIEAAIFIADEPLTIDAMKATVLAEFTVTTGQVVMAIEELVLDYAPRGIKLVEVASGYQFRSDESLSPFLSRLWHEQAPRYSRALMETLALIVYRQPITRGEIEDIRGVAVSSNIIRTLKEREWIKEVGHKEVPGRPALFGTTRQFLDYFGLKSLGELPDIESFAAVVDQEISSAVAAQGVNQPDLLLGDGPEQGQQATSIQDSNENTSLEEQ